MNPSHDFRPTDAISSDPFSNGEFMAQEFQPPIVIGPRKKESYWKMLGAGSLGMSILIHALFILVAIFLIKFVLQDKKEEVVDFLPGGGGGGKATEAKQAKKHKAVSMNVPKSRLTAVVDTSNVTLPDAQPMITDMNFTGFAMPSAGGTGGGSGLGKGLGKGNGMGNGVGDGNGPGFGKGFVASFFGSMDKKDGMKGSFYDLKQGPDQKATGFQNSEGSYAEIINDAARARFTAASFRRYYKASRSSTFNFLTIPRLSANEGPKAFGVEKEVQPSAWFVHYAGTVSASPDNGPWRFVGFFDDALIVYVNSRPVLDGSWYPIVDRKQEGIRENFGGPALAEGNRQSYAGKWVNLNAGDRIDIIVGERPGGLVGGALMIENKHGNYGKHPDGTPILPIFSTQELTPEDRQRVKDFAKGSFPYPIEEKTPIFTMAPIVEKTMTIGTNREPVKSD